MAEVLQVRSTSTMTKTLEYKYNTVVVRTVLSIKSQVQSHNVTITKIRYLYKYLYQIFEIWISNDDCTMYNSTLCVVLECTMYRTRHKVRNFRKPMFIGYVQSGLI
jgi:hypothetical protein